MPLPSPLLPRLAPLLALALAAAPVGAQPRAGSATSVSAGPVGGGATLVGSWVLDAERSDFGPQPRPSRMTRRIQLTGAGVEMTVVQLTPRGEVTGTFRCPLDGATCRNAQGSAETTGSARWDGDALVVTTTLDRLLGPSLTTVDRYALSADGQLLTVDRTFQTSAGAARARMVFRRG